MIDASICIALAPADGTEANELLKNADMALYGAKAGGRGVYRFFEADMDARMKDRRALELALRKAFDRGEFELHYQPVVNLHKGKVRPCEALLRWHHPQRGMVSPAEFIPIAEEIGLIVQLAERGIRGAWARARRRRGEMARRNLCSRQSVADAIGEQESFADGARRAGVVALGAAALGA